MRRVDGSGLRKIRPEGEGFLSITTADFVGGKGIYRHSSDAVLSVWALCG